MKKETKHKTLKQESLKRSPFEVPEGYFEQFPQKMLQRIREPEDKAVPVYSLVDRRGFRVAAAAAILVLALVSYPLFRLISPDNAGMYDIPDIALLEELGIIDDDRYLVDFLESGEEPLDDEEAYIDQAIHYLALNDVEMDIILNE